MISSPLSQGQQATLALPTCFSAAAQKTLPGTEHFVACGSKGVLDRVTCFTVSQADRDYTHTVVVRLNCFTSALVVCDRDSTSARSSGGKEQLLDQDWNTTTTPCWLGNDNRSILIWTAYWLDLDVDSTIAWSWLGQHSCSMVTGAAVARWWLEQRSCSMVTGTVQLLDSDWNSILARWWLEQRSCSMVTEGVKLLSGLALWTLVYAGEKRRKEKPLLYSSQQANTNTAVHWWGYTLLLVSLLSVLFTF